MTQKQLLDKIESIINSVGVDNAILAIELMYNSYLNSIETKSDNDTKLVEFIKSEVVELF